MKILVAGASGQLARSLCEIAPQRGLDLLALGRPVFDITNAAHVVAALDAHAPDVVINAAAYTAVDKAEEEREAAAALNAAAPIVLAEKTAERAIPIIHFSTDYVFNGTGARPWTEQDQPDPCNAYGMTKRQGEIGVAGANPAHVIMRSSWVYSPFGENFVKTMLRLAAVRNEVSVVADQIGAPTSALDMAGATVQIAQDILDRAAPEKFGIFHMSGSGEGSWADMAAEIFNVSAALGGPSARVVPVLTAQYPTRAVRPANSRLSNEKLAAVYGIQLPPWRESLRACVVRLVEEGTF